MADGRQRRPTVEAFGVAISLVQELCTRRRLWPVLAALTAFLGGVLVGVLTPAGGGTPSAKAVVPTKSLPVPELRLEGKLPAWLAPGARLTVTGWAGPNAPVALVVGGKRIASAASGPMGRFTVTGRVGKAPKPLVEVTSAGERKRAGRLVVRPIVFAAGGDVTPGEGVSDAVTAHGEAYPWTGVAPLLRSADIATVNLEGAISDRGTPALKEYTFRGGPGLLHGAARVAGIDLVSVANNHTLDYGRDAFLDTLASARRAGLKTVGGGATLAAARRPAILEVGGLRIAVLGYSDVRPAGFDAGPDWAGAAPADPILIAEDITAARRGGADLVVVWFHWGEELEQVPNSRQRVFGESTLASGANLVLGAHPHVLQPLERQGKKLVAWSLGNFVFPSHRAETTRTGVLLAKLDATGVTGYRLAPATISGFRPFLDGPGGG